MTAQPSVTRVLVAEDEAPLRNDGEEALRKFRQEGPFDLVILDIMMPRVDGFEVLQAIRQESDVPVVMLTALGTAEDIVRGFRLGADDYITKPFKINDLLVSIRRCLEEAKFVACDELLAMDDTFKCLANAIRRNTLMLLKEQGKLRFMDITRKLDIDDHTKVNFHLKILKDADLLEQDGRKQYQLSPKGKKIVNCMGSISTE